MKCDAIVLLTNGNEGANLRKWYAAAFTEWERRYREEPERFQSEATRLLKTTPKSYGDACAPYFMEILGEIGAKSRAKKSNRR